MTHFPKGTGCGQRTRFLGLLALVFGIALVAGACSPYPVYNHATVDAADRSSGDDNADWESSEPSTTRRDSGYDEPTDQVDPSSVDPRVFERVVEMYMGTPYKLGGDGADGIDCSNLASSLYRDYSGKRIPSSTRSLYRLPRAVAREDLQVGDLVFFSFGSSRPSHVGIYMGNGRFVHASESNGVVYSSLETPYYRDAYRGARRVM